MTSNRVIRDNKGAWRLVIPILACIFFLHSMSGLGETTDSNSKVVFVSGMPDDQKEGFVKAWKLEEKHAEYLVKAREFFKKGEYDQALSILSEALNYVTENRLDGWNIHWRLAEVYEKLRMREDFVKEIDWLLQDVRNEETRQKIISWKDNVLSGRDGETHNTFGW